MTTFGLSAAGRQDASPTSSARTPSRDLAGAVMAGLRTFHAEWNRRRNERVIEGLAPELRKDIGWPAGDIDENGKRH